MSDDRPTAPALQLCRIALRPRGPLESLDLTVRVAREWWRPLLLLAAATLVPAQIACSALLLAADGSPWALIAPVAIGPLVQAPFTLLGGRLLFAERVRLREVFTDFAARFWPWSALQGLQLTALSTCFVLFPLFAVPLAFATECALLERVPTPRALRRSWRLTSGAMGGALVGVFGHWVIVLWAAVVAEVSAHALASVFQVALPVPSAATGVGTPWLIAGILVSHPIWALWRLLLYVDARTRVEGWDLQVGLRAAGLAR